jgi:hypothetical protein
MEKVPQKQAAPKKEEVPAAKVEKMDLEEVRKELTEMVHDDHRVHGEDFRGDIDADFEVPEKMQRVHEANTEKLKHIVEAVGWPSAGKVGNELSKEVWLLVRHADQDVEFQKLCLGLMKQNKEDVGLEAIAYVEDRVRVNEGGLQLYGTQFKVIRGAFVPKDIASRKSVNVRRKKMGLPPLEETLEELTEKYHMNKPQE